MKNKLRHNPNKPQNNYGGDYDCIYYDTYSDKREFCHQETVHNLGWSEWVVWWKTTNDGKLICKGNRHNCGKERLKWLASLSESERNKYLDKK